jgi:hypothetical protein
MTYNPRNLASWWASMQKADAREWVRVSAETGDFLRTLSGREDLLAVVEPGICADKGAPAVYLPEKAHVEVNPDKCATGIAPADISMTTEVARLRHPALTGASVHEGAHAMVSQWELDQTPARRRVVQAALLLEESRAEKHMVESNPETRVFLRAAFTDLVNASGEMPEDVHGAAHLAALSLGRADAGVLDHAEVADLRADLVAILGEDLLDSLRAVWLDAHALRDHRDKEAMEALGQRWIDLLPEPEAESAEGGITVIVCGMPSSGGSGGGEGSEDESEGSGSGDSEGSEGSEGKGSGSLGRLAEAVAAAAEAEAEAQVDGAKVRDEAERRAVAAKSDREASKAAEKVFSDEIGHGHGYGYGEGVKGSEAPSVKVRATANRLARAIQKAQFRDRSKTVLSASVPPGRLKSSAAVRRSAQQSQGIPVTAEPWRQTVRKHVDQPPVTVGIMVDISGSMRWAEQPVAELAWSIAHAVNRNEGTTATVAYGERVHAVTKPGESPKAMRTFDASGGTEEVAGALKALDGGLHLTNGRGVRMLVNVSDGQYTHSQREKATAILRRMTANGVKVLWIDADGGGWAGTTPITMPGVTTVKVKRGADLADVLAPAITKALSEA